MFNGIDVTQMQDYIKIDCHTYMNKFCNNYLNTWLHKVPMTENRPTPLPTDATWIKKFNATMGPTDPKEQLQLATKNGDQIQRWRWQTHLGNDYLQTQHCLY
jgi:hypothetical protein